MFGVKINIKLLTKAEYPEKANRITIKIQRIAQIGLVFPAWKLRHCHTFPDVQYILEHNSSFEVSPVKLGISGITR